MVPYERFDAWKMTHQLALQVYKVTESWPVSERYGLTIQIRRAALSAPTNMWISKLLTTSEIKLGSLPGVSIPH
jgi:hypothetical protein